MTGGPYCHVLVCIKFQNWCTTMSQGSQKAQVEFPSVLMGLGVQNRINSDVQRDVIFLIPQSCEVMFVPPILSWYPSGLLLAHTASLWNQLGASLVAQMVNNLPAMWETQAPSLVRKIPWRREWQLTPVSLPGEFHGQRSLKGYSPWVVKSQTQLSDFASRFTFP